VGLLQLLVVMAALELVVKVPLVVVAALVLHMVMVVQAGLAQTALAVEVGAVLAVKVAMELLT
jgi:hypothetical protein